MVTAGDAALYAERNDVDSFVEQTVKLMDDRERRVALGRLARQRIENGLTWEHQAKILVAMYGDLLDHDVATLNSSIQDDSLQALKQEKLDEQQATVC